MTTRVASNETWYYTIGRAILVFAGGTAFDFKNFGDYVKDETQAKGPDFISRLKAHLNIVSINELKDTQTTSPDQATPDPIALAIDRLSGVIKKCYGINKEVPKKEPDEPSCRLLLRRAILLRSFLVTDLSGCITDAKIARIDKQVIKAFLHIPEYKHGNRSLRAIVQMAALENDSFRVASLASEEQLNMHVDGKQFLKRARGQL